MIFPADGYRPHDAFLAAARAAPALWRTLAGTLLIGVLHVGLSLAFVWFLRDRYGSVLAAAIQSAMLRAGSPAMLILLLFTFLSLAAGPLFVVRALHGRSAATLFGPPAAALADFLRAAGACLGLTLLVLPVLLGSATASDVGLGRLILWLPLLGLATLVQTGAEELVFRGYLQQQLGARFRSPWLWMGLPSALFAWGHYLPETYGPNAPLISLWALAFGCCAADLTARTGTLGAALGFHFANNLAAFALLGSEGQKDGLALWTQAVDWTDPAAVPPLILTDLAWLIVSWLAVRLALRV